MALSVFVLNLCLEHLHNWAPLSIMQLNIHKPYWILEKGTYEILLLWFAENVAIIEIENLFIFEMSKIRT